MSNYTHIYAGGESERAACGGRMTKHTTVVPTCPSCKKSYLAREKFERKFLLKTISKHVPTSALTFLYRAVYLAKRDERLMVNSFTNKDGKTGLDTLTLDPNTEFVLFTSYKRNP